MDSGKVKKQHAPGYRIDIRGLVQGVGFRPFVFRLASSLGLKGWVENRNDGVVVMAVGAEKEVMEFRDRVIIDAPLAASVELVEIREEPVESPDGLRSGEATMFPIRSPRSVRILQYAGNAWPT